MGGFEVVRSRAVVGRCADVGSCEVLGSRPVMGSCEVVGARVAVEDSVGETRVALASARFTLS